MEKEFAPFELAVKLKALGFDEPCMLFFSKDLNMSIWLGLDERSVTINTEKEDEDFLIPTFSQAFRWFREKYNLYPSINIYHDLWMCLIKSTVQSEIEVSGYIVDTINNGHPTFNTYEEAELACLEKLIEIVKSK